MARLNVPVRVILLGVFATILLSSAAWGTATETVLYNFCQQGGLSCQDGQGPNGELVFDAAGNLYGTTTYGGAHGGGIVFELSPSQGGVWTETVLYSFCAQAKCADGQTPEGSLIFDSLGNLYGTTFSGGAYGYGTVFELSPSESGWTDTVLYSFCSAGWPCPDPAGQDYADLGPDSGVAMDHDGNLFGVSAYDSIFELSPSGGGVWTKRVIYFVGNSDPAGVALDATGNLYGMSEGVDQYPGGYVFKLSEPDWNPSVLFGFTRNKAGVFADGYAPNNTPVFDKTGNLYGTTYLSKNVTTGGTAFRLTPKGKSWEMKLLHTFTGKKGDGVYPLGPLTVDSSGNVYGTTYAGGVSQVCNDNGGYAGCGTVYELSPNGTTYTETVLWKFNITDGESPMSGVILDKAGNLYGTAYQGGSGAGQPSGVVFEVVP
ncbi:MAG: choice-of-anchor tandem repeat GloVer-containing protein [Terriglobales bacterium]|jgi:uncharacterized repeat protein (TIGR03803 family)